jgi:hypothetical protein
MARRPPPSPPKQLLQTIAFAEDMIATFAATNSRLGSITQPSLFAITLFLTGWTRERMGPNTQPRIASKSTWPLMGQFDPARRGFLWCCRGYRSGCQASKMGQLACPKGRSTG